MSAWAHDWPWAALLLLGAYHGINPAMGWLFAVALGMQERSRRAVWKALVPIGLGHALAISAVVALVLALRAEIPHLALRIGAASVLIGWGIYKIFRSRHPRWVGMRVGFRDLTLWSFLMASAHGAGLMLVPIVLWMDSGHDPHQGHMAAASQNMLTGPASWWAPVAVHTLGYLLVTGAVAALVYEKFGLELLRKAWFDLDLLWAGALIVAGVAVAVFV